jgi:hypothetical protein
MGCKGVCESMLGGIIAYCRTRIGIAKVISLLCALTASIICDANFAHVAGAKYKFVLACTNFRYAFQNWSFSSEKPLIYRVLCGFYIYAFARIADI